VRVHRTLLHDPPVLTSYAHSRVFFLSLVSHEELRYGGYQCPKCLAKLCELPSECVVCGLTLVSSPHLARSYHHLFPVPSYESRFTPQQEREIKEKDAQKERQNGADVPMSDGAAAAAASSAATSSSSPLASATSLSCRACCRPLHSSTQLRTQCPLCRCVFCVECDVYIHTVLHCCPGCLSRNEAPATPASVTLSGQAPTTSLSTIKEELSSATAIS
jgi:transcription initiation factor TFIIH subunit 2